MNRMGLAEWLLTELLHVVVQGGPCLSSICSDTYVVGRAGWRERLVVIGSAIGSNKVSLLLWRQNIPKLGFS